MSEKHIWMGFGAIILIFLVVTTPGWQEVLGLNSDISSFGTLGEYMPAIILLGFMGALVAFVLIGGDKGGDSS